MVFCPRSISTILTFNGTDPASERPGLLDPASFVGNVLMSLFQLYFCHSENYI